ncbi:ABC transporter ATP-binding protein [Caldiplasma sukawensis]
MEARKYEGVEERYIKALKGRKALRKMISDVVSHKRGFAIIVISVITTAAASTLIPLMVGFSVNQIDYGNLKGAIFYAFVFLALYGIQFLANNFRAISTTEVAQSTVKELREKSFNKIQRVPISFFSNIKSGFLISRITNDGETIGDFLTFQIPQVVSGVATIIISISIMIYYNAYLTMYAIIVLPFLVILTLSLQGKVRQNYLRTRRTIAAITGNMAENINSIRSIKAFNVEKFVEKRFEFLNSDNLEANIKASRLASIYGSIVRILEFVGIIIVILEGVAQLQSGLISIGILVSFILYVQEFFDPVIQLSQLYNSYQSSIVGVGRLYGIINSQDDDVDGGKEKFSKLKKGYLADSMSFSYGGRNALDDINVEIAKGEKIGIVGHTGAGKTTFSNILLKFITPTAGKFLVDENDIKNVETKLYRQRVAVVLQEPFLFNDTIINNVKLSNPEISEDQINEIAKTFGLDRIFKKFPNGLQTKAGELGRNLSEGQKQAVAILRAIIRDPDILIMDEPTSSIDLYSERLIFNAIKEFSKNRTLILITHRFTMIDLVDRIMVLKNGKLIEHGTKDELMKKNGEFFRMYNILYGQEDIEN